MIVKLSSLKFFEPEKIKRTHLYSVSNDLIKTRLLRIEISHVRDWHLKTFNAHDLGIQNIRCLTPQKMNYVFNDNKCNCLL